MKNNSKFWIFRLGLFTLFLIFGLLIFFVPLAFSRLFSTYSEFIYRTCLAFIFLFVAIFISFKERFQKYCFVFHAFAIASFVQSLCLAFSGWTFRLFHFSSLYADGIAVEKLGSVLFVAIPIIVLTKIMEDQMDSIYLKRGNIKLGIIIGLTSLIVLVALAVIKALGRELSLVSIIRVTPWILVFALANAFSEELLFRGLFLKKFEQFLGPIISNLLAALIFVSAHIKPEFASNLILYLISAFILSLAWGYIIQKTNSLIGSVLFHAGFNTFFIVWIFADFGISQ